MKLSELTRSKLIVAADNRHPDLPVSGEDDRHSEINDDFELLDATSPDRPYTPAEIMKAMAELHRRIERQAANYGGDVDHKTGKIDRSKHRYFDAKIARKE